MTLGEKIQNCRKLKGVSQEEVASALGVSRQALSKWECNTSTPDIDKIVALSNYFNVTTDYLLKDECTDMNIHFIEEEKKLSGNIPITVSTAIIIIGLFVTFAKANDGAKFLYWEFSKAALGIGIQVVGICVLEVLYYSNKFQMKNQYFFGVLILGYYPLCQLFLY